MGGASGANLIATAYVFGGASIVFATMPFMFAILKGILKANQNQHSASIGKSISIAYLVHIFSCIFFVLMIKLLDKLNQLSSDYTIEGKIFEIFWTRGKSEIFALAGASGSVEEEGAYLTLYAIQLIFDLGILFMPIILLILAFTYALLQTKKDSYQNNYTGFASWLAISLIVVILLYLLWAKIAGVAMFMPSSDSVLSLMQKTYIEMLNLGS